MASIIVVGGGVAGLTCAWRLRRAGYDVEVLERESTPGGRLGEPVRDGFDPDGGGQEIRGRDRNLASLLRTLAIPTAPDPAGRGARAVLLGGRLQVPTRFGLLRDPALSRGGRIRLAVGLARRFRHARHALEGLRAQQMADLDGDPAAEVLSRLAGSPAGSAALAPLLQLDCDAPPEALAWPVALAAWGAAEDRKVELFDAAALRDALNRTIRVRTGCEVTSVETETGGARLRYRQRGRERSAWADAAVVALPSPQAAAVCAKLTPEERGFLSEVESSRSVRVHLALDHPAPASLWREIAVPASEQLEVSRIRLGPGGRVTVSLSRQAAAGSWDAADASLADLALESLSATPVGVLAPRGFAVERKAFDPLPFGPGALRRLARFHGRLERSPRLAFAGEDLVGAGLEAVVTAGSRAATEVARSLGSGS